jgi:dehydrogenase/reductase SDR family protein 7B
MSFEGQNVWITGASSGIGAALAGAFSAAGASLLLSARRAASLEQVRDSLPHPENARVLPLDLERAGDLAGCAAEAERRLGRVDVFVNSAGISQRSLAKDTRIEVDRRLMEVNFFGPVALMKALLPAMRARRSGHIVAISSLVGKFGTPMRSGYAASKHALHGFLDSLRAEAAADRIAVTLVCPGYVRTEITLSALTGDGSPYGRIDEVLAHGMPPDRCAAAILRAVSRRKREVLIGGKEVGAAYVARFFPGLFARVVRRSRIK